MKTVKPLVYIIIINWNNFSDTVDCLKSLSQITYSNYRIVVVDNGSTDDSVKELKSAFPQLNLIETKENLGFSGGNNLGIKFAFENRAEYVLLLNNDTVVSPDFLSQLVQQLDLDSTYGIVGPVIYHEQERQKIWWAGGSLDFWLNFHAVTTTPQSDVTDLNFQTGCCCLIRKEVVNKVGLLDEKYFLYYEDADYGARVRGIGYKIGLVRDSKIWHKVSSTTKGELSPVNEYYYVRNKLRYGYKNLERYQFIIFLILYTVKLILKSAVNSKRKYGLRGYLDFWGNRWGSYRT